MKWTRSSSQLALTLLAALLSLCNCQADWECVPTCKCIWVSGKKTAECKRQNLTEVPSGLSKEIQHLDLTGNLITHLNDKVFTRVQLDNLQKLIMRECGIKAIHAEAFHGLKIVIEIDLSNNRIRQLHRGTFDDTERLRVLLLNQNRLQKLDDELFHDLHYLQKVELSDNHLVQIGQWTFRNLPGLQTLTLDGNNLTRLNMRSFESLPKLGSLELRKNPWHCDCHLKPFRDWSIQRKLYTRPTTCERPPSLVDRMWDEIPTDEFACMPQIEAVGAAQRDGSAELWCKATALPKPQISWVHRQRIIGNATKRHADKPTYLVRQTDYWANLTIGELGPADKGEYVCVAKNFAGSVERNVSLIVIGDFAGTREGNAVGLPLAIGLGIVAFLFLLVALTLCLCYCKRRRAHHDEKSAEAASLDHHGLGEQEKSLITAINPVVKPPRRYEAPSVTSHGTEMTELNRTLLDNDSVFGKLVIPSDGVGSVVGVLPNGLNDTEDHNQQLQRGRATPDLESMMITGTPSTPGIGPRGGHGGSLISGLGTLSRNTTPYRQQYPPDLLAFSGGRTSSPTSQASTAPDNTRLLPITPSTGIVAAYTQIGFKTLPHPVRSSSATPYSLGHLQHLSSLPRHGYGTIPRRPRAPSWSSAPPISPTERESAEPVYDNLGARTSADGSSKSALSLYKSPDIGISMRNRPLPLTPTSPCSVSSLQRHPRASPALIKQQLQFNRSAPEGACDWSVDEQLNEESYQDEQLKQQEDNNEKKNDDQQQESRTASPSVRKVPPRPPPKPKKKNANGPLYEDEGEDGTEV